MGTVMEFVRGLPTAPMQECFYKINYFKKKQIRVHQFLSQNIFINFTPANSTFKVKQIVKQI